MSTDKVLLEAIESVYNMSNFYRLCFIGLLITGIFIITKIDKNEDEKYRRNNGRN